MVMRKPVSYTHLDVYKRQVIGGVLFHELWEAKSRYVFPYFIMMIPMAAEGLGLLSGCLGKRRTKDEASESG